MAEANDHVQDDIPNDSEKLNLDQTVSEPDASPTSSEVDQARRNRRNLKRVGYLHAVAVVTALTIFGAAHTWAVTSGWALAIGVSIAAAFFAGMVLSSILHEWGHYTGAWLSGSAVKVAKVPINYYFMFEFDMQRNTTVQALSMSAGGLAGSWLLVLALLLLVPLDAIAGILLIATVFGRAVNASVFEIPVILRTQQSEAFEDELNAQLKSPGIIQWPGLLAGGFALAVMT